jgi:hypothetical protein
MPTILEEVEDAGFTISEDKLRELLALRVAGSKVVDRVDSSYFKILLGTSIAHGSVREAHNFLYPIVKESVCREGLTSKERNRATNFARSAYSVLLKAEKQGLALNMEWTKSHVQKLTSQPKPLDVGSEILRHVHAIKWHMYQGLVNREIIINLVVKEIVNG